ncbi:MAG: alpha/beta fold hydrolase [Pirellulales bacterium]|nr:alpha/beta fold hydrolase [Pirellulales bacterium]
MSIEHFPPFRPHPLIPGGHAQTLAGFYDRVKRFPYRAQRHEVLLEDGDALVLHEDSSSRSDREDRIVLLVPGLGGSFRSPFMARIAGKLNASGFRTFRMDLRGCGSGYRLARLPGHAGRSEDTTAAVRKIAHLYPHCPVTAVGFSMGANIVLKMLGETGCNSLGHLDSGVGVAPPIDLLTCSQRMLRLPYRLYGDAFLSGLLREIKRRGRFIEEIRKIPISPLPKTVMEFDNRFTAPLSGFLDVNDYYEQSSSGPLLARIKLRSLVLAARDDPVIPVSIFKAADFSSSTEVLITNHGGHIGYVGVAGVDADRRWLDWRILDWVQNLSAPPTTGAMGEGSS